MLNRKQLEDAGKCATTAKCSNCSLEETCRMITPDAMFPSIAQTAIALVDMLHDTTILLNDHFNGEKHYSSNGEMDEAKRVIEKAWTLLRNMEVMGK